MKADMAQRQIFIETIVRVGQREHGGPVIVARPQICLPRLLRNLPNIVGHEGLFMHPTFDVVALNPLSGQQTLVDFCASGSGHPQRSYEIESERSDFHRLLAENEFHAKPPWREWFIEVSSETTDTPRPRQIADYSGHNVDRRHFHP